MSLNRIAARIAAVQALKGRTLVGNNILDSQIGALDIGADGSLMTDVERPFVSVYTDAAKIDGDAPCLRAFLPNGETEFLFEAGVAAAHVASDAETGEKVIYPGIPGTDAAFEFHLDMVMRQIGDALTDPTNEWGSIFLKFISRVTKSERARTSGDGNGTRLAAQQLRVTVELLPDPVPHEELKPGLPLAKFFAKAAGLNDPAIAEQIALMQAQLAGTTYDWQTSMRRYGLTRGEADSMLITPPAGAEADVVAVEIDASPAEISA